MIADYLSFTSRSNGPTRADGIGLRDLRNGYGQLTSIDIDQEICELFAYRQSREGHSNPSNVICTDILLNTLSPERFDMVTVIGSTAMETSNYEGCLESCWRLVAPDGLMRSMDFTTTPIERVKGWIKLAGCVVHDSVIDQEARAYAFWLGK